ncbi:MAG: InlB B-repeat-containing protein [Lachnospiraceae bacterium]|nr:InlB B-repeat-containing protein [Lachnospiraceae bacterium]
MNQRKFFLPYFCLIFALLLLFPKTAKAQEQLTPTPASDHFTVSFQLNYNTSVTYPDKTVTYGKKYGKLPAPERKGYTFEGWYTDSKNGTRVKASTKFKKKCDVTLYAHWTAKTYKIKLNSMGGKVSKSSYKKTYGKKYGNLAAPTKDGYTFMGWFTKKSGGKLITSTSKVTVTKNTTLYAHWDNQYPGIVLADYNMPQAQYNQYPYVQTQTAYRNVMLGHSSYSLARSGCLTCNIALIMTYNGIQTLPTQLAQNSSLYTSGGLLIWGNLPNHWSQEYISGDKAYERLYELLASGNMPSVCLSGKGGMHWVTVYGFTSSNAISADKFLIFDPGKYSNKTLQDVIRQKGGVTRIIYMD